MIEFLSMQGNGLAYQRQIGIDECPGIIFLSGFASDMEGTKAVFLSERCATHSVSFVRFDYRGCGRSSGQFTDGTIGAWFEDTLAVFDQLTQGPQIVVGSSMGGWLGLLLAKARPERVKTFIGVAAAPDFTEDLVWDQLTALQREALRRKGEFYKDGSPLDQGKPLTLKLIEEARAHLILRHPLPLSCPVRLLQGMLDQEVPWQYAARIAAHVSQDDVRMTLIKDGDHRLSRAEDLELLWQTVSAFLSVQ
jgi:pimeloyl-ACP methyl ester carboxylesterase